MLAVKTLPKMKTVKKEKVICYLLNGKRDYAKEKAWNCQLHNFANYRM